MSNIKLFPYTTVTMWIHFITSTIPLNYHIISLSQNIYDNFTMSTKYCLLFNVNLAIIPYYAIIQYYNLVYYSIRLSNRLTKLCLHDVTQLNSLSLSGAFGFFSLPILYMIMKLYKTL